MLSLFEVYDDNEKELKTLIKRKDELEKKNNIIASKIRKLGKDKGFYTQSKGTPLVVPLPKNRGETKKINPGLINKNKVEKDVLKYQLQYTYQRYELSITFNRKKHKITHDKQIVHIHFPKITEYLESKNIAYYIVPEITPSNGYTHYHGIMWSAEDDAYSAIASAKRFIGRFGRAQFDQITDLNEVYQRTGPPGTYDGWYKYIHKDRKQYAINSTYHTIKTNFQEHNN